MDDDEYEASLGRPMTKREKFERKQRKKEKTEMEEEDHAEEVSFQDNYMYIKFIVFSGTFFYACYLLHL